MKIVMLLVLAFLVSCAEQVDEGYRGIKTNFGKVADESLTPGIYFYIPFISNIFEMNVKEEKIDLETECFTKDTQTVKVTLTVTYYPEASLIHKIYSNFGQEWEPKVIAPAVLGSIKDSIGQYAADELVSKREIVKVAAQNEIIKALKTRSVVVSRLDMTNLDFRDEYESAVEAKVVATQQAEKAKNESVRIAEEAKQKVVSAKAEAESMKIRSEALSQNKSLVEYEAVQKWNGVLPTYMMGNSVPFISLGK